MATRQEFLARVRREVGRASASFAATVSTRPVHAAAEATVIRRQLAERWPGALARFQEEFERVGGVFHRAATAAAVPGLVASIARDRTARSIVTWGSDMLGLDLRRGLLAAGELDVAVVPAGAGEEARQEHRAVVASADLGVTGADA